MSKIIIRLILWVFVPLFIGLIPVGVRIMIGKLFSNPIIESLDPYDLITFGLILSVHNITQTIYYLMQQTTDFGDIEKALNYCQLVISILLIIAYGVLLSVCMLLSQGIINQLDFSNLRMWALSLNGISVVIVIIICVTIPKN